MKEKAKQALKHPLIQGSGVVVIGNFFGNIFNFLFNLFMVKTLTAASYGVLATVIALITFPNLAAMSIVPLVVHFAGSYFAKGKLSMARGLYIHMFKSMVLFAFFLCIVFLFGISYISRFFHIENIFILFVTIATAFLTFINVINISFLQAKLAFTFQVFTNILAAVIKLLLGVVFVLFGFSVSGATVAIFIGLATGYVVSFSPLRFIFDKKVTTPKIPTKELFHYGFPSTLTILGLTSFITTDIILIKHFFDPTQAGIYASLSVIGRVIFYLCIPIGWVMFPVLVQKFSKGENVTNTFKLALLLVFVPSILLTGFYYLFPEFTILLFARGEYLVLKPMLWIFGLFMTLYCLLTIIANFYLSIKKTKVCIPILIGAFLQIVLITLYHASIFQVIMISLKITFLLVIILLLYYPYAIKK